MHLVNDRTVQRDAQSLIVVPVERIVNYHRFGNAPGIIAEILSEIFVFASDNVAEHFIRPAHVPRNGFRIRIEKEFRAVEPQPALRIVRTGNAKTVQLPWSHIRQKYVPDLVGVLGDRDANIFFGSVNILEQAKLNRSGRFGKKGKVDAVAQPRRAQGIWITEPGPYRSHKRAAHLCGMERGLAITNVKSRKQNKERRLPSRRVCNLLQCGDPAMAGPLSKREHLRALHLATAATVRKPAFPSYCVSGRLAKASRCDSQDHFVICRHLCAGAGCLLLRTPRLASLAPWNEDRSHRRRKSGSQIVDLSRRQGAQDLPRCAGPMPYRAEGKGRRHENAGRNLQDRRPECAKQLSSRAAHFLSV